MYTYLFFLSHFFLECRENEKAYLIAVVGTSDEICAKNMQKFSIDAHFSQRVGRFGRWLRAAVNGNRF